MANLDLVWSECEQRALRRHDGYPVFFKSNVKGDPLFHPQVPDDRCSLEYGRAHFEEVNLFGVTMFYKDDEEN